jgi:hypothetical protein
MSLFGGLIRQLRGDFVGLLNSFDETPAKL